MRKLFTRPDAWTGGSYEIALEYQPLHAEEVHVVLKRLWSHTSLNGCYLRADVEPEAQLRVPPASSNGWLRGIATLPNGDDTACGSVVVTDEDATWIYFGSPMGSLIYSYPVGAYPFDDGLPLDWRTPLNDWLCDIARFVFEELPFQLGLVGWIDPLDITASDVSTSGVPETRYEGYLIPEATSLTWYPPNTGAPMRTG
ncbi:MAG: hypothetical protein AAF170_16110 [Bacteroidota bacterium]